jgi:hypothetical protein
METSGFYKNDSGMILYAPNFVEAGSYNLYIESKDTYEYPIGGWYYFDSEEEAYLFWNLPLPKKNSLEPPFPPPPPPPFMPN